MENYETLGTIGEGTYGVVLKARHKETGQIVAIKKFKESDEDEQVRKTALREVRILKQLKHDNIVNLIEVFRRKGKLHLVFEFVERTILEDLERNPEGMDPMETRKCLWQLLRSIEYCHSHHVIHRDIKPENLLVSRNGTLKLCDFGFARTLAGPGARYTDYVATRWYRGPELLTGDTQYGKPVDIWAIGCMLPEMASGAPLFPGESDIDQLFHIMRCFGNLPPRYMEVFRSNPLFVGIKLPDDMTVTETLEKRFPDWSEEQLSFMKNCLKYEPEQRCTCAELMQHPYFTEDGFVTWFEKELKQMLERDAQDFKMRQKKFRKGKAGRGEADRPPPAQATQPANKDQQPPQSPQHPGPLNGQQNDILGDSYSTPEGGAARGSTPGGTLEVAESGLAGAEMLPDRRPATREAHSSCGLKGHEFGDQGLDMPMLPNLTRPTTPRAQRLVAFPHLSSALEDQGAGSMPTPPRGFSHALPAAPTGKASRHHHPEVPSMPQLQHGTGVSSKRADAGSSNLPQLQEGQPFAAVDLPDRGVQVHGALAPASRGVGGSKKKTCSYDPNNPYAKPPGKLKKQPSKGIHSANSGSNNSTQMGVVGQAQSISGLAAAYGSTGGGVHAGGHPGDSSSSYSGVPPRTPQEGSADGHTAQSAFGICPPPVYANKLQASHNYGGGQYAKYGKRY